MLEGRAEPDQSQTIAKRRRKLQQCGMAMGKGLSSPRSKPVCSPSGYADVIQMSFVPSRIASHELHRLTARAGDCVSFQRTISR
jgi:hypothetical protein